LAGCGLLWRQHDRIAGGIVLPLFMVLGSFGSNQVVAIGSIAAVLDGIVSLGSNVSRPSGI